MKNDNDSQYQIAKTELEQVINDAYHRGFNDALKLASETFNGIIDDLKKTSTEAVAATPRQPLPETRINKEQANY